MPHHGGLGLTLRGVSTLVLVPLVPQKNLAAVVLHTHTHSIGFFASHCTLLTLSFSVCGCVHARALMHTCVHACTLPCIQNPEDPVEAEFTVTCHEYWEFSSVFLEEKQVPLTTEPSLQPYSPSLLSGIFLRSPSTKLFALKLCELNADFRIKVKKQSFQLRSLLCVLLFLAVSLSPTANLQQTTVPRDSHSSL